ncbi:MAG: hypothetical protein ABFD50_08140 [Smithella sp.]
MTQANYFIGANQPGLSYRTADNLGKEALLTCHKGSSRPTYAEAGTIWIQDPGSGTLWKVFLYDGTVDILMGYAKITGATIVEYIAAGSSIYAESSTRSGNDYVVTTGYSIASLKKGDRFTIKDTDGSDSAIGAGLIIDGLSSVSILKDGVFLNDWNLTPLNEADILGNAVFEVVYNGTDFQLLTPARSGYQGYDSITRGETIASVHRGCFLELRADLGTGNITLPDPTITDGFGSGFFVDIQYFNTFGNYGEVIIEATDTDIDGDPSIPLRPGQGVRIVSDGIEYYTLRGKSEGFSSKDVFVNSSSSISADSRSGQVYVINVSCTITTPPVTDISTGWCMIVKNRGTSTNITIDTFGAETIDDVSSITVGPGQSCAVFLSEDADFYSFFNLPPATQSDQETATSTTTYVTPGRQQYHPSAAKAWVSFNGTGTPAIRISYNVTSLTDGGTGLFTVNFTTAFSTANYAGVLAAGRGGSSGGGAHAAYGPFPSNPTTSAFAFVTTTAAGAATDCEYTSAAFYGDQ